MKIVTNIHQLREPTKWVKDEDISEIVANLFEGLKEYNALGLSANQLGYDKRIFVMVMKPYPPVCIVNPVITKERGNEVRGEACLSLPETRKPNSAIMVKRPKKVTVKGLNQYRKPVKYRLNGQQARTACHEVDHLTGKLITDYKQGGGD